MTDTQRKLKDQARNLGFWQEARTILQAVAKETQEELEYRFSELLTLAMEGVFAEEAYEVKLEFVLRRDKTEVDIWFMRDGQRVRPMEASGLGAVDVACMALRVTMWLLQKPKSRNTIVLDEPFKHLKGELANERALRVIREISHHPKIQAQMIMVSDERVPREMIMKNADRVLEVGIDKGRSQVEVL